MKYIGFMTGTSLDGVDVAVLDTDGEAIFGFGKWAEYDMPSRTRALLEATIKEALTWPRGAPQPAIFDDAEREVAKLHIWALERFCHDKSYSVSDFHAAGVHGQTVLHERPHGGHIGRTVQLFDAALFAKETGLMTVSDFRSHDVAQGGEGAPLAPVYHKALARYSKLDGDVAVLNLGGVANITAIKNGDAIAFDTGPANGLMDQWMRHHGAGDFDHNGLLASQGRVDQSALNYLLAHDYFLKPAPKSLDRYDFSIDAVKHLSLIDGMATLCAFTCQSIKKAAELLCLKADTIILGGGGRLNSHLVKTLRLTLPQTRIVLSEELGWRGGAIEAEAFAYMAARTLKGLPLSFPTTTGVKMPLTGGVVTRP